MKDLISRQAAIDAVDKLSDEPIGYLEAAIDALVDLPSAQPDVPDTNVGDMISRQSALQAINEYLDEYSGLDEEGYHGEKWCAMAEAKMVIENLPSAQPDTDRIYAALSKAYNVKGLPDEAIEIIGNLMLSLDE